MSPIISGGVSSGGGSLSQVFSLTAQQIKDSTLTPHAIIAAQGAGKLIVPTMYVFDSTPGGTPFSAADVELVYGSTNLSTLASILTQRYVGYVFHALTAGWAEGGDPSAFLNQPLRLRASLRGAITALSGIADAGTGYAVGDTGTVDFGSPDATYIVTAQTGGNVTAVTITSGGDGYNLNAGGSASTWTTTPGGAQPGAGSGLQVLVSEVDASASAGDGTLSGVVYYEVAALT